MCTHSKISLDFYCLCHKFHIAVANLLLLNFIRTFLCGIRFLCFFVGCEKRKENVSIQPRGNVWIANDGKNIFDISFYIFFFFFRSMVEWRRHIRRITKRYCHILDRFDVKPSTVTYSRLSVRDAIKENLVHYCLSIQLCTGRAQRAFHLSLYINSKRYRTKREKKKSPNVRRINVTHIASTFFVNFEKFVEKWKIKYFLIMMFNRIKELCVWK